MPAQFVPQTLADTHTEYVKKVSDTIVTANPFFRMLQKKGRIKYNKSGISTTWVVRTGTISLTGFSPMTSFNRTVPKVTDSAVLAWGGMCGNFIVPTVEAQVHDGENAMSGKTMMQLFEETWEADSAVYVETALFTDNSSADPPQWSGIPAAIRNPSGGSYAGLSMTTYPGWACQYANGSSTYLGKTFMQAPAMHVMRMKRKTQNTSSSFGKGPDIAITTEDNLNGLVNHINQGYQRIISYEETAEFGATGVKLAGMDFYWSPACPSGNVYGLDSSTWELRNVTGQLFDERSVVLQNVVGYGFDYWNFGNPICDNLRKNFLIDNVAFT